MLFKKVDRYPHKYLRYIGGYLYVSITVFVFVSKLSTLRVPACFFRFAKVNAGAMFPIIATQFGVNRWIEKGLEDRQLPVGAREKIGMAMVAGSVSAVFGCPAEYLMIQQQRNGGSLAEVFTQNAKTLGSMSVYRGLVRIGVPMLVSNVC